MPDTFHAFPFLPIELRLQIWTLTLPPPYLFYQRSPCHRNGWTTLDRPSLNAGMNTERRVNYGPGDASLPSKRPIPAVLHICRETRLEYLAGENQSPSVGQHPVYAPVVFFKKSIGITANPAFVDLRNDAVYTIQQGLCTSSPFSHLVCTFVLCAYIAVDV